MSMHSQVLGSESAPIRWQMAGRSTRASVVERPRRVEQTPPSDLELLQRWRRGCRRAGDALMDRHAPAVYRFFRGKVTDELDDLVQQTFLACIETCWQFREESSFRTYLLAIARHKLYARYGQRRRESQQVTLSWMHEIDLSPMTVVSSREQNDQLLAAIEQLPQLAQRLLERAYVDGLSGPEIARSLDIPLNTVYSRLRRARDSLRALLRDEGRDDALEAEVELF